MTLRSLHLKHILLLALGGITAAVFLGEVLFFLWHSGKVELPSFIIHSARIILANIAPQPTGGVKLDLPFHQQEHSLSCEMASLKNAFYAYGLDVPEAEIIRALSLDPTPRKNGIWGDPQKGFVGSVDGRALVDGYGVYAEPIARVGLRWKRTEVLQQPSVQDLAYHITLGHPIIVWGYLGRGQKVSWTTPEGKSIVAVNAEHTRLVYGFEGSASDPQGFFLIDPTYGHAYWKRDVFMENWEALDRMAVVVYPHPRWVRATGTREIWEISKDGKTRRHVGEEEFMQSGGFPEAVKEILVEELDRFEVE
ncbi:MAG: C39 family peptidase [bacterium]|nr:C39 family peptidase [bacterium]